MKILKLTIKKKWFDMILSGEKTEEYREFKMCYIKKFMVAEDWNHTFGLKSWINHIKYDPDITDLISEIGASVILEYDKVTFYNGGYYSDKLPNATFELKDIVIGKGNSKWGAPEENVFILKLGEKIYD